MLYFLPIYHDIGLKGENSTTKRQQKAYHNNYRTLALIEASLHRTRVNEHRKRNMRSLRLLPRSSEIMDGSVPNILGSPNNVSLSTYYYYFLMT